ncbi:PREDICTED: lipoma HMGIC fusion partner-like 4 protein [Crocodylus porosus]|uniref:lipoma HMGIC fusion partner-like 4 protein n=1 Tax=Crocodylus porosus TaxID=8502 RepID=UPI00093CC080|nr:PREDICTED: lipoma HMGIC fusion partner-like 4 protein [Crocodylus porosus]
MRGLVSLDSSQSPPGSCALLVRSRGSGGLGPLGLATTTEPVTPRLPRPLSPCAALCLVLGCMIFPDGWDAETIRDMCGEKTGKYALGDCSVRWAYILAIIGILNALILSFLAFVLGNRQNDLLHEEFKTESKDFVGTARI